MIEGADLAPHEHVRAYVQDRIGRLGDVFAELSDELFEQLIVCLSEQLGAYLECVPLASLTLGEVTLREGEVRSYLLAALQDRGGPLRLRDALRRWEQDGDVPMEFVGRVNARRWRFVDRYMVRLIEPLLRRIVALLGEYYARRPFAVVQTGMLRLLEDVDATFLCVEIDDRSDVTQRRNRQGYMVQ